MPLVQWYLEPATVGAIRSLTGIRDEPALRDHFATDLSPGWAWHDPLDDCSFEIGRGKLYGDSERIFLRLERIGGQVNAYCSADGEHWSTAGHVAFPVEDPVQVGVHAIGNVDCTVYHGAYPDGTAIRFESFHLWQGGR